MDDDADVQRVGRSMEITTVCRETIPGPRRRWVKWEEQRKEKAFTDGAEDTTSRPSL